MEYAHAPFPMETLTWPTKIEMFPISVYTLPVSSVIGFAETVADAPAEPLVLVGVALLVAVERSTVVVVPGSCRRPRKAATPGEPVAVVADVETEVPGLTVEVGLAVEVTMDVAEDCERRERSEGSER